MKGGWIILIVLLVVLVGYLVIGGEDREAPCKETIEDKAILDASLFRWVINIDNEEEFIFTYRILNYGDANGENIKIRCFLEGRDGNEVFSVLDDFGNLTSREGGKQTFTTKILRDKGFNLEDEYSSACYVESCDDCEILWHRLAAATEA